MNQFFESPEYLRLARANASRSGYDPKKLQLANDGIHKLIYETPDGKKVKFGRLGYGDYLYYKKFEPEKAEKKRNAFKASHGAMSEKFNLGKYSANELALNINW